MMLSVMPLSKDSDMKSSSVRWKVIGATLFSIVVVFAIATKQSPPTDGIGFLDAKEVKTTLTESELKIQDTLVADFTTYDQFAQMSADDQAKLVAVANATWYKEGAVLGYSIDRRGRVGLWADASSSILLEVRDGGRLVFNCVNLTPQPR